jgi:hypothetical protein
MIIEIIMTIEMIIEIIIIDIMMKWNMDIETMIIEIATEITEIIIKIMTIGRENMTAEAEK